jgi:hypothetical protein
MGGSSVPRAGRVDDVDDRLGPTPPTMADET